MAKGTIYGTTANENIDSKIEWSSTVNVENNSSMVTAALYYKRNNTGFTTYGEGYFYVYANGISGGGKTRLTITEHSWVKAAEVTTEVLHLDDGTKSINIHAIGSLPDTSLTSTHIEGSAILDTIRRAMTVDSLSCATNYFDGKMTYKYMPISDDLYCRCNISLNLNGTFIAVKSINLGKQSVAQKTGTVTLEESELSTIYNKLPSAKQGKLRFTFRTYSDSEYSTQVGDAGYKEITLFIPDDISTKPYVTEMVLSPVHNLGDAFAGLYIQGMTKVKAVSKETGQYGATIAKKSITVEGKSYESGSNYTSDYISGYGLVEVKLTLEDTRGFRNTKTYTVAVIPYSKPIVIPRLGETSIVCARCDVNGNLTDSGTYLRIRARRSFSPCMANGVQKNFCGLRFRYKNTKESQFSEWQNLLTITNTSTEEVDTIVLGNTLSITSTYVVQIDAVDSISNHSYVSFDIPTEEIYLHKAGSLGSLGIGEYVQDANIISIAKNKSVRLKSNINGVRMYNKSVSGTKDLDLDTKYIDFSGSGNERQTFFVFGEANGKMVYGVARVANNGKTLWAGTEGVTLTTKNGGILTVVLPAVAYDVFTIISGRDFTV